MIPAVLIDDEPLARSLVREYLEAYPQIQVLQECGDGFEGIKAIMHHRPALVFLDVQMPKINGFEMLELVEEPPAVIFITAFDEYAIKAFEAHAVDYLLKPFSRERFNKAVEKFLGSGADTSASRMKDDFVPSPQTLQRVVVKTSGKIKIIPVEEIAYIEAADDYVKVNTREGTFLKKKTMAYFEAALQASHFVRTHRSFILNVQQVTKIEPYEKENYVAVLKDGKHLPVSRSGYSRLKEVLGL